MRQATEGATTFEPIQVPSVTIRWPDAAAQSGESRRHIVLYGDGERGVLFGGDSACPRYAEIVSRNDELISVNGKLVHGEARLREHDVVRVGDNEIRFSLAEADEPNVEQAVGSGLHGTKVGKHNEDVADRIISVADFISQSRALRVLSNATASLLVHHPFPALFDRILDCTRLSRGGWR